MMDQYTQVCKYQFDLESSIYSEIYLLNIKTQRLYSGKKFLVMDELMKTGVHYKFNHCPESFG